MVHNRRLGAGLDAQRFAVHPCGTGLGFDIGVFDIRCFKRALGDMRGTGQMIIRRAAGHMAPDQRVFGAVRVQLRGICGHAVCLRSAVRQGRPSHREIRKIQRLNHCCIPDDQPNGFAAITGLGLGKCGLVRQGRDHAVAVDAFDIFRGDHCRHASGSRAPCVEITKAEFCVVVGATNGAHQERTLGGVIRAKHLSAVDLWPAVNSAQRLTHGASRCSRFLRNTGGVRRYHRLNDLAVTCTTAQHARERVMHFGFCRLRHLAQQFHRSHHNAGGAYAALGGTVVKKTVL